MSRDVNKVTLVGRLGKDPEIRYTGTGKAVADANIATEDWKFGGDGKVQWHRLKFWEKKAEIISEHAKKGSHLYVEGRIDYRDWEDKEGNKRVSTEIVVTDFKFLGGEKPKEAPKDYPQDAPKQPGFDEVPF